MTYARIMSDAEYELRKRAAPTAEELDAVRAERDRYIARCKELEARLQKIREAAK